MGRAYEVRKASIQKTGAIKAKLYSMYAKEIYLAAKNGGTEVDSNINLKRLIDKAKKEQVPGDIIKRAIDKVNSGINESYESVRYELFGPGGSTLLVDCLTDNVNRSVSNIRAALNKTDSKLGVSGSVGYLYDNLCILSFKGLKEEEVLETLIEKEIEIEDIEVQEDSIVIYGKPSDLYLIKEAITSKYPKIVFDVEEISALPKDKIELSGEAKEDFIKLLSLLDDNDDVTNVYHNVNI